MKWSKVLTSCRILDFKNEPNSLARRVLCSWCEKLERVQPESSYPRECVTSNALKSLRRKWSGELASISSPSFLPSSIFLDGPKTSYLCTLCLFVLVIYDLLFFIVTIYLLYLKFRPELPIFRGKHAETLNLIIF